ncbi:MAG: GTPase ObgE [bacterium]|nr:GTPase ObgE [bacterium]
MFIDQSKIIVKSGKGGDGCVSFRREKYVERGGPDGGNGGRGGEIYLVASTRCASLYDFTKRRHFFADNGINGKGALKHGKAGKDVFINVPCGTLVYTYDLETDTKTLKADLVSQRDKLCVAKGGRGGRGNATFKSSNRTAPSIAEKGAPSQEVILMLELKLIANVGLLGYPNAGKSTFLAAVTNAKPKIADYPFTTLKPNLGVVHYYDKSLVIVDIPGIVSGAHQGVGLGFEFLRHVERTRFLLHLIDVNAENIFENFENLNQELLLYNEKLATRKQVVLITKQDTSLADLTEVKQKILASKIINVLGVFEISAISRSGLDDISAFLYNILDNLDEEPEESLIEAEDAIEEFILKKEFSVAKSGGVFYVKGEKVERLASMTYFDKPEALMRFQAIIDKMGVNEELKANGIAKGDLVIIADFEFYYQ